MTDIVLATINAKYIHASFGLRYLAANLGDLASRASLHEFSNQDSANEIAERLLREDPRIIGLGVYVWNAVQSRELVSLLKRIRPNVTVVIGGPEVSHEVEAQEICALADYVVCGEGEIVFRDLCAELLGGSQPSERILRGGMPDLGELQLPYSLYNAQDIEHRLIYVEASRGCPFRCEFCLSALDTRVRPFPRDKFLAAMEDLIERGVRHFKFVDRTFNLRVDDSTAILEFFLEHRRRLGPGLFVHFEMIPDRMPAPLRTLIEAFPEDALQLEIGIQSLDSQVTQRIGRQQDLSVALDNLQWLRQRTHAHVHADLIIGLPGEDACAFGQGFDRLLQCGPQEIQVGVLKRLRGAPIARHEKEWGLVFRDTAPYDVLHTHAIDYGTMQRLKRFAHVWGSVVNSGNFLATAPLLWAGNSAYSTFLAFADWVYDHAGRVHSIALDRLAGFLLSFAVESEPGLRAEEVREALRKDYNRTGRRLPGALSPAAKPSETRAQRKMKETKRRQAHHARAAHDGKDQSN